MIYQFSPSSNATFQFQPTLDGVVYTVSVKWNVYGSRYYVVTTTVDGTLIYSMPLIGSPDDYPISLLPQLNPSGERWTSQMYYLASQNSFVVTP